MLALPALEGQEALSGAGALALPVAPPALPVAPVLPVAAVRSGKASAGRGGFAAVVSKFVALPEVADAVVDMAALVALPALLPPGLLLMNSK